MDVRDPAKQAWLIAVHLLAGFLLLHLAVEAGVDSWVRVAVYGAGVLIGTWVPVFVISALVAWGRLRAEQRRA